MESLQSVSLSLFVLVAALAAGYLYGRFRLQNQSPVIGQRCRIRTPSGVVSATYLGDSPEGWRFGYANLSRDPRSPEPHRALSRADSVVVELAGGSGVALFRGVVVEDSDVAVVVTRPRSVRARDRRGERRLVEPTIPAWIDGTAAQVEDLGSAGVRLMTAAPPSRGQRVKISLAGLEVCGWVLDAASGGDAGRVRVRFEETLDLRALNLPGRRR